MKNLLPLLLFVLTAAACGTANSNGEAAGAEKWTMIYYVAFMPEMPDLEAGDIVWTMDNEAKTLQVESQLEENWGPPPGKYTYEFVDVDVEAPNGETLRQHRIAIEGAGSYLYSLEGDTMVLNSNIDPRLSQDGPIMTFRKM